MTHGVEEVVQRKFPHSLGILLMVMMARLRSVVVVPLLGLSALHSLYPPFMGWTVFKQSFRAQ